MPGDDHDDHDSTGAGLDRGAAGAAPGHRREPVATRRRAVWPAVGLGAALGSGMLGWLTAEAAPAAGQVTSAPAGGAAPQTGLLVVDAHVHATPVWYEPIESVVFQHDRNGVAHGILTQIGGYFDNQYQEDALRRYPGRFAAVVLVDWTQPDAVQQLETLAARGTVSGVRLPPDARSPGDDPLAIWRAAARLRLSVSVNGNLSSFSSDEFPSVIQAVPEIPLAIEHLGSADAPDGEAPPWPLRRKVLDLARYRNVYIQFGGLGEFATRATPVTEPFPFVEPIPPFLEWAYESFGPGRMMWGSDYGLVSSREGFQRALQLAMAHFADKSQEALRLMFGGTALTVFPLRA
jgi:L-fuconolactonase